MEAHLPRVGGFRLQGTCSIMGVFKALNQMRPPTAYSISWLPAWYQRTHLQVFISRWAWFSSGTGSLRRSLLVCSG